MPSIRVPARLENLEPCKTYLRENLPARFADQWNNVQLVAEFGHQLGIIGFQRFKALRLCKRGKHGG